MQIEVLNHAAVKLIDSNKIIYFDPFEIKSLKFSSGNGSLKASSIIFLIVLIPTFYLRLNELNLNISTTQKTKNEHQKTAEKFCNIS